MRGGKGQSPHDEKDEGRKDRPRPPHDTHFQSEVRPDRHRSCRGDGIEALEREERCYSTPGGDGYRDDFQPAPTIVIHADQSQMKDSDDTRNEESLVKAGIVASALAYCLASIGEKTMEIKFTTGASPLGSVLVAATAKGVCAVSLRESAAGAEEYLRARFAKAEIKRDDAALKRALDAVLERIAGRKLDNALSLDLQGTDFQQEVWNQLLSIPAGSTRTYLDVAQAIKRPKATRAVAQACGANPVAVVVPCHRVVMSDGSIGGYSGLPGVKKALLAAEGVKEFVAV